MDLPGVVDRIVMKALHPDVESRYPTALEMAVEVETHLAPASQRVVGEWVAGLAGEVLEHRAGLLQQIEISHIHSIAPMSATDDDDERTLQVPLSDDGEALRAFGSPKAESAPSTRRWIIAGFMTGLVTAVAAAVLLRVKPSNPTGGDASAWPQQAPLALPVPTPTARSSAPDVSPMPTPANPDSQDPTAAVAKPAQSSRARPVRPAPSPPRHASTRPGNSTTFLPDDL